MGYPTAKRMARDLQIDMATARRCRRIIDGTDNPLDVSPAAQQRQAAAYNPPERHVLQLEALNEILGLYGVEYIKSKRDDCYNARGIEYVNTGDTYALTIMLDLASTTWFVASWGDIIERDNGRRFE